MPVSATVDLNTGRVDEVEVWCEGIQQCEGEHAVVIIGTQLPAAREQRVQAQDVVDSEPWPTWRLRYSRESQTAASAGRFA